MAEIQYRTTNELADAKHQKGFWSNLFGRSTKAEHTDENKDEHEPKQKRFMDSLVTNARQAATKEVMHLAEKEAEKEVESQFNGNNNKSQSTNTTTDNSGTDPSTTDSDPLNATTSWAKRMVNGAQQKVQNLQTLSP